MPSKQGVLINGGGRNFLKNLIKRGVLINGGVGFGVRTFEKINKRGKGVVGGTNEVVINS